MIGFSFPRLIALMHKEWIQVRRDAITLRILIAIPIMQLFLVQLRHQHRPETSADRTAARAIIPNMNARSSRR